MARKKKPADQSPALPAAPGDLEKVTPSGQHPTASPTPTPEPRTPSPEPQAPTEAQPEHEPPLDEAAALRTFEALLFVSDDPLPASRVRQIVPGATPARVRRWAEALGKEYDERGRAFSIREISGGWQLFTRPEYAEAVARLTTARAQGKLSTAALETLAIIAYRQPINRADLEAIRGVGSGPLLQGLLAKGLVRVAGKEETLGRPVLYGTTDKFLQLLGLASLKDLPKPEELKG